MLRLFTFHAKKKSAPNPAAEPMPKLTTSFLSALAIAGLPLAHASASGAALPPSLLAIQTGAQIYEAKAADGAQVELIDLNPSIGRWLLLRSSGLDGKLRWAHLDLGPEGASRARLSHDASIIVDGAGGAAQCHLDTPASREALLKSYPQPFAPACSGKIFVRSRPAKGYKSSLESVTDWLRDQGSLGEQIISWRKDLFPSQGDSALEAGQAPQSGQRRGSPQRAAPSAQAPKLISTANLGFSIPGGALPPGGWAPIPGAPGAWASVGAPAFAQPLTPGYQASSSLAYFMAIDLSNVSARYSVGVDHPTVGWSTRAQGARVQPGPDGFDSIAPLERVGMVPPWHLPKLAAVISGGFKREHSAFKGGPLSQRGNGTHYGFAEAGVALSKLHIGLATFFQREGEPPQLKTWDARDEAMGLNGLIFARQNGLPLVDDGAPGKMLGITAGSNWSGNQDGDPETMRSALCVARGDEGRSFLIYGVFSKAMPKDMAQLMIAYGCTGAMQLDMNAPALTYAAVMGRDKQGRPRAFPLLSSMADDSAGPMGRFVHQPDTRDFLYLISGSRRQ